MKVTSAANISFRAAMTKALDDVYAQRNAAIRERDAAIEERDRMLEALKPFAVWCEAVEKFSFLKDEAYVCAYDVRLSDLRRARAAIEGVKEPAKGVDLGQ